MMSILSSCEKDFEDPQNFKTKGQKTKEQGQELMRRSFTGDSLILQNPYSVTTMGKALSSLKANYDYTEYPELDNFEIQTTHYYLKFKPQNEEQEGLLKKDSTLHLFNYRLDCEYNEDFLKNRTPTLDSIPDYYTSIKAGHTIPNVPYDVIEELYIPEQETFFEDIRDIDEYQIGRKIGNKTDLFNLLLWEAYSYTGNEKELLTENSTNAQRWIFGSKWYPSGIVAVHDDIVGTIVPVSGAQILMRQWFTVRSGITWANGAFVTGFVRGYARYIIQWERYHYSIRNGAFFQAETRGPEVRNLPWLVPLFGGDNKYHAHIHQAAHDYYYGGRFGLTSPPTNSGTRMQMKIAAREMGSTSSYSHIRSELTFGISPQISIKRYGSLSDRVYGVTIHELAHGAHQNLDATSYNNMVRDVHWSPWLPREVRMSNERTYESWAVTVETFMTLDRYRNRLNLPQYQYSLNIAPNGQNNSLINFQKQTIAEENIYTSCGIDMIDNFNQRLLRDSNGDLIINQQTNLAYENFSLPIDKVSGYTIKEVELGLYGAQSWLQWRNNMMTRYTKQDDAELIELFNNWQ